MSTTNPSRSSGAKAAADIIEVVADFLRSEWLDAKTFEGWPFLPERRGQHPTAGEANAFLLGCCIDYRQLTRTAWRKTEGFCSKRLGLAHRDQLWKWIAEHDEKDWESRWAEYDYLHPTPARHRKLHSIARSLVDRYGGDARQLWNKKNVGRLPGILQNELRVGPQISRMIIGGLRDHGLINIETGDLKADTHVVRLMNAMGLSKTSNPEQVAADARRWFADPWFADTALYHLGATYEAKTKRDVLQIYRTICRWREMREKTKNTIEGLLGDLKREYGGAIKFYADSSLHWAGVALVEIRGPLTKPMYDDETLWAWAGFGFDGKLVSAPTIAGSRAYFSRPVKALLKARRFIQDPTGAEARRGNLEYYATTEVGVDVLRQPPCTKEALSKQVRLLRDVLDVMKGAIE